MRVALLIFALCMFQIFLQQLWLYFHSTENKKYYLLKNTRSVSESHAGDRNGCRKKETLVQKNS